jgi:hypothetical protein
VSAAHWFRTGLLVLSVTLAAPQAPAGDVAPDPPAPGIYILDARSDARDEVHYLDAQIDFVFSPQIIEAIEEGVPLSLVLTIEIMRERAWLWNEKVTGLEQRYQISYHALTRQYVIRNMNIGTQHNYPTFAAALSALGTVAALPLIDANLLQAGQRYRGRLQARVDTSALPTPLRLIALVSPEWRLVSEWREWAF